MNRADKRPRSKVYLQGGIRGREALHVVRHPDTAVQLDAFLAVTNREVALIKYGPGGRSGNGGEGLARVPRSEVVSAAASRGALRTNLTVNFADGGSWAFEVSPLIGRTVVHVADALGHDS